MEMRPARSHEYFLLAVLACVCLTGTGCGESSQVKTSPAEPTGPGATVEPTGTNATTVEAAPPPVPIVQVDFPLTDAQAAVVNSVEGLNASVDIDGQAVASGVRGGVRAGVRGGVRGGVRAGVRAGPGRRQASSASFAYRLEFDQPKIFAAGEHKLTVRLHDPRHPEEKDHLLWLEDKFKGETGSGGAAQVAETPTDSRFVFLPDADKDGVANMIEDLVGTNLRDSSSVPTADQVKKAYETIAAKLAKDQNVSVAVTPTLEKPSISFTCKRDRDGKECSSVSPISTQDAVTFEFACTNRPHCSFWCGTDTASCPTGWSPEGSSTPCASPLKRPAGHYPAGHCGLWIEAQDEFGNSAKPGDGWVWFDVVNQ